MTQRVAWWDAHWSDIEKLLAQKLHDIELNSMLEARGFYYAHVNIYSAKELEKKKLS